MPILTAAGADCTVLDYSEKQLQSEKLVAEREGYEIKTIRADMTKPLPFADETFDFMTVSFMHDESISDLYVGKVIKKGNAFYDQGGMGNGNKNSYGDHVHMAVWKGKTNGRPYGAGNVYVFDALYINRSFTSVVNYGKCSKSQVYNNAPSNYKNLWRYLP